MKVEPEKKDKLEFVKQTNAEIQKQLIGSMNPKKGHTLFEANLELKTIQLVKFDRPTILRFEDAKVGVTENKKVNVKENCRYISALNRKNVVKILKRDYNVIF